MTYLAVDASGLDEPGIRTNRRQVYGSGITQEPYQSDQTAVRKSSTSVHIAADGLSLLDMLRRWQGLEDDHHPLIETYGAMLSATDEHPRSRFLLLVQALEAYTGTRPLLLTLSERAITQGNAKPSSRRSKMPTFSILSN